MNYAPLDEATLLHGLYHGTRALGPFGPANDKPDFSLEDAKQVIASRPPNPEGVLYFDYLFGRPLKVKLRTKTKEIDDHSAMLYDRDAGPGRCAEVILDLLTRPRA